MILPPPTMWAVQVNSDSQGHRITQALTALAFEIQSTCPLQDETIPLIRNASGGSFIYFHLDFPYHIVYFCSATLPRRFIEVSHLHGYKA